MSDRVSGKRIKKIVFYGKNSNNNNRNNNQTRDREATVKCTLAARSIVAASKMVSWWAWVVARASEQAYPYIQEWDVIVFVLLLLFYCWLDGLLFLSFIFAHPESSSRYSPHTQLMMQFSFRCMATWKSMFGVCVCAVCHYERTDTLCKEEKSGAQNTTLTRDIIKKRKQPEWICVFHHIFIEHNINSQISVVMLFLRFFPTLFAWRNNNNEQNSW